MKPILLLFRFFLSILFTSSLYSQIDTVYYDADWNRIGDKNEAAIIGYKDYDENGIGIAKYYWSSGELNSEQNEHNSRKEGKCKWFYKNGNLMTVGSYTDDKPIGEFSYYSENGTYIYTNVYNESHELRARYMEGFEGQKVYDMSDTPPLFSGFKKIRKADAKLNKFVKNNFDFSLLSPSDNLLKISILISPDGKIDGIQTPINITPEQKVAVESLVYKMPNWLGATHEGEKVYAIYYLELKR